MSQSIECPACGKRSNVAALAPGQPFSCPACGTLLSKPIEVEAAAAPSATSEKSVTPSAVRPRDPFVAPAQGKRPGAPNSVRTAAWLTILVAGGVGVLVGLWIASNSNSSRRADAYVAERPSEPRESAAPQTKPIPKSIVVATSQPARPSPSPTESAISRKPTTRPETALVAPTPPVTRPVVPEQAVVQRLPLPPAPQPIVEQVKGLTDEKIGRGIQDGVNFLIRQFDPARHELRLQIGDRSAYHGGMDALCVYALMQAGQSIPDERLNIKSPFMAGCVDVMKSMQDDAGPVTYARGIRATALALYNRLEDRVALHADVKYLLESVNDGAYTYAKLPKEPPAPRGSPRPPSRPPVRPSGIWDNSNSQYGLLGVWSGAEAEVEVPFSYWRSVQKHWTTTQLENGQWGYGPIREGNGTISMTSAGIASLLVTHDWLDAPSFATSVGREPYSPELRRGLAWFEAGDNAVTIRGGYYGYTMYGVERVGLASGFKYFGDHEWYRELSEQILKEQGADGSWGEASPVETAYCLLFLARGRHPVMMNKLRFDGTWDNRPRDVANLARYGTHQLERPVNWQVVPLDHRWQDWLDSPILYLASHKPVKLLDRDYDNIRDFINAGGMLFTQADGDSPAFNVFAGELAHKLFPGYELTDVPANHPIYSTVYKVNPKPPLRMVSNGSRILMLHSAADISRYWQLRDQIVHKPIFEMGVNMFVYAAGKRDLRNRLDSNYVEAVKEAQPRATVQVARLQYAGNWDPEPYAWTRFARVFQRATGYAMKVNAIDLRDLKPGTASLAVLTGNSRYSATSDEVAALRVFVEAGGVVLIDSCGGSGIFQEQLRESLLAPAFPSLLPRTLRATDLLLTRSAPGMEDLTHLKLRPYTLETLGDKQPLPEIITASKGHVISTAMDLTSGLLGTSTWGINGYETESAQSLVKNIVLWTMNGQEEK